MYDICIIGAGVVGTAIARELSKYQLKIALIDKAEDVSQGASKANSGIVHGGYAASHGTLKAELCVEGNRRFEQLQQELRARQSEIDQLRGRVAESDAELVARRAEQQREEARYSALVREAERRLHEIRDLGFDGV